MNKFKNQNSKIKILPVQIHLKMEGAYIFYF